MGSSTLEASALSVSFASGKGLSSADGKAFSITAVTGTTVDISPPKAAGASFADESAADITSFVWLIDASALSSTAAKTCAVIDLAILSA